MTATHLSDGPWFLDTCCPRGLVSSESLFQGLPGLCDIFRTRKHTKIDTRFPGLPLNSAYSWLEELCPQTLTMKCFGGKFSYLDSLTWRCSGVRGKSQSTFSDHNKTVRTNVSLVLSQSDHVNSAAEQCGYLGWDTVPPESSQPQRNLHPLKKHGIWSRCVWTNRTTADPPPKACELFQTVSSQAQYYSHILIIALPIWDNSQEQVSGHQTAPCPVLSVPNSSHTSRGAMWPLYRTWASWFGHMHRACLDLLKQSYFLGVKIQCVVYVLGLWLSLPWQLLQWGRHTSHWVWQRSWPDGMRGVLGAGAGSRGIHNRGTDCDPEKGLVGIARTNRDRKASRSSTLFTK